MSFFKKEQLTLLGNIYDLDGKIYSLHLSDERINKYTKNLYEKANICEKRNIILKLSDSVIDQEYAVKIKFDFSKSDKSVNLIFLEEFIVFPYLIQQLIEKSILSTDMIFTILNSKSMRSESIENSILVYQDIFEDKNFIKSLKYNQLWLVITQNAHRSVEKLKPYKRIIEVFLDTFFSEYLLEKHLNKEPLYEEWKRLIKSTIKLYLPTIDLVAIKERCIHKVSLEINKIQQNIFDLDLQMKSLKSFISQMSSKELDRKDEIMNTLLEMKTELLDKLNLYKEHIENIEEYI